MIGKIALEEAINLPRIAATTEAGTVGLYISPARAAEYRRGIVDINVRGVFYATQAALKHLKSGGRISHPFIRFDIPVSQLLRALVGPG